MDESRKEMTRQGRKLPGRLVCGTVSMLQYSYCLLVHLLRTLALVLFFSRFDSRRIYVFLLCPYGRSLFRGYMSSLFSLFLYCLTHSLRGWGRTATLSPLSTKLRRGGVPCSSAGGFLPQRFCRVASPSLRICPTQGGDRPRGNGFSCNRNSCGPLRRALFVGYVVVMVVLDAELLGFVFSIFFAHENYFFGSLFRDAVSGCSGC